MITGQFGEKTMAMKANKRHAGFSLIEMMVVVVIVSLLAAMVMPIVPQMLQSNRQGAARDLIRGYLTLARAHAAQTQKYAGIRFQQSAKGVQYMVLIEHNSKTANHFFAVANTKPIALPDGIGVISAEVTFALSLTPPTSPDEYLDDSNADDPLYCLDGACTFSIIFSPTGQLVSKGVRICERDYSWVDKIFGPYKDTKLALSHKDFCLLSYDNATWPPIVNDGASWCGYEYSTGGLFVYDKDKMDAVDAGRRYSDYVYADELPELMINMYTGTLIELE